MNKLESTAVATMLFALASACGGSEAAPSDSAITAPAAPTVWGSNTNGFAGSGSPVIAKSEPIPKAPVGSAANPPPAAAPAGGANPVLPGTGAPPMSSAQVPPAVPPTTPPAMPTMPTAPTMPAPRVPGQGTCLQGSGGYDKDGPYGAALTMDVELPGLGPYTIFYPANLEAECPHPIVSWGNGTGVTGSATYAAYHRRAASWGIVTIASHNDNAGSMPFIEGGIDYLIAENAKAGSIFQGKLSDRAGVAGHSQGGIAATTASKHPKVQAEVCVQGGGFGVPANVAFMCQTGVDDFLRGMCTGT